MTFQSGKVNSLSSVHRRDAAAARGGAGGRGFQPSWCPGPAPRGRAPPPRAPSPGFS